MHEIKPFVGLLDQQMTQCFTSLPGFRNEDGGGIRETALPKAVLRPFASRWAKSSRGCSSKNTSVSAAWYYCSIM
jgi:hypothetical protein